MWRIVISLKHYQMPRQGDDLQALVPDAGGAGDMFLGVAADDVVVSGILVHHAEEHLLDARAFLVDGVVKGIHQVVDTLDDLLLVHHAGRLHVVFCQLLATFGQALELDALRMGEEQQIDGLMHGLQLYLTVAIVNKKEGYKAADQMFTEDQMLFAIEPSFNVTKKFSLGVSFEYHDPDAEVSKDKNPVVGKSKFALGMSAHADF